MNGRGVRVRLQNISVKKYPIAFAVVSPACVVIHGLPTGRIGRKFGRIAKVVARAEPVRLRWRDGEIAAKPRLNIPAGRIRRGTHASAGGGQFQIWNNKLFEFSMIPGLPDSRDPS